MPRANRSQSSRIKPRQRARFVSILAICAVLLTSCSSNDTPSDSSNTTQASPNTTSIDNADNTDDTNETGECRVVEHLGGNSCVPIDPQRIVVLDPFTALPTLLDLGAPVVGATSVYPQGNPFPSYIDAKATEDIQIVGSALAPNLEAIAAAKPDLIIAMSAAVADIEDLLDQIAPTVIVHFAFYAADWRDDVRLVAELVNGSDAIDAQLAELDARAAEIANRLSQRDQTPTISNITTTPTGVGYYRYGCTWIGNVLRSAGVDQPAAQDGDNCTQDDPSSIIIMVSPELIPVVDADAIVAFAQPNSDGSPPADPFTMLANNPLWPSLNAVEADSLFALGEPWGYGGSISAALLVLDDLDQIIFP